MHYYVGWWWWLAWVLPMFAILWAAFAWGSRRSSYGGWHPYRSGYDRERESWVTNRKGNYRNRGPRNYRRADDRILEDVSDRLMLDDDIDASSMEVQVQNGAVTLTGTVASRYEKRLAEHIADSVAGVTDVDNRLRIGRIEPADQSRNISGPMHHPA